MKTAKSAFLLLVLVAASLSARAGEPAATLLVADVSAKIPPHTLLKVSPRATPPFTNFFVHPLPGLGSNRFVFVPRPGGTNFARLNQAPMELRPPRPGVYQSSPWTCIVVVPKAGEKMDPGFLVETGDPGNDMPVVKPELRLTPFPGNK